MDSPASEPKPTRHDAGGPPDAELLHRPGWYRALSLPERVALLRAAGGQWKADPELAAKRLERWRRSNRLEDDAFARRLRAEGLTVRELEAALGAEPEELQRWSPEPPAWVRTLIRRYAGPATAAPPSSASPQGTPAANQRLWVFVRPLLNDILERTSAAIRALADAHPAVPFAPEAVPQLLHQALPAQRLWAMFSRPLILELNVARLRGDIAGDTAEARYDAFIHRLHDPAYALRLLEEYPVLARGLVGALEAWSRAMRELFTRLVTDWDALRGGLLGGKPGPLESLSIGQGDTHRGGRSVAVLRFASGRKLVYKPRSLAVEAHFQDLLRWLNAHRPGSPLRTLDILERGAYGWVEFAEHAPCESEAEVSAYYERLGALMAVMAVLDATDMHFENLIASGPHPLLIDLECLFQPRSYAHRGVDGAPLKVGDEFHTVLRVGLLPSRSWGRADHPGIDNSAMGASKGQELPDAEPWVEHEGTDQARFVGRKATLDTPELHRPTLRGADIAPESQREAIVEGFRSTYRFILEHRQALLAKEGPLAAFKADEIRVLVRDTRTYGLLEEGSFHPDHLRDALDRDRLLDRLWNEVASRSHLERLVPAEQEDLRGVDIPLFTTRPDSTSLWTSREQEVPGIFRQTSMAMVERQVGRMDKADLERQVWAIQASLDTLHMNRPGSVETLRRAPAREPRAPAAPGVLLALARSIGERLEALAIRGDDLATWVGFMENRGAYSASTSNHSLNNGSGGTSLFLAHLARLTGEQRFAKLAVMAANTTEFLSASFYRRKPEMMNTGAYLGWGCVTYTLSTVSALLGEERYRKHLETLTPRLAALADKRPWPSVGYGAAGNILGLLAAAEAFERQPFLDAARVYGELLLSRARRLPTGLVWIPEREEARTAYGFARGNAGIAHALSRLAAVTGEARYREAAREAIAHERTLEPGPDASWSRGAVGVGLARLHALREHRDAALVADVEAALTVATAHGFGWNHSLDSGDPGCLELLLEARRDGGFPRWASQFDSRLGRLVEDVRERGFRSALPTGREDPGFLRGLAGMGYQLLRLAAPEQVPSVTLLEPLPRAR